MNDQRRRVARAYADGGLTDAEYEARVAEIDARQRQATVPRGPSFDEAVEVFADLPRLWELATLEERRKLLGPLVERVYLDIESKRIGAITPTPDFALLLEHALEATDASEVALVSPVEQQLLDGSWRWWRRGRIELPVQKTSVLDLLRV